MRPLLSEELKALCHELRYGGSASLSVRVERLARDAAALESELAEASELTRRAEALWSSK